MDSTKGPITASIPQSQAEAATFSAVAILDTRERLAKEVRKLAVGRSQSPRRRCKSHSPSPTTAVTQTSRDCAFITVTLARRHKDGKCPIRL